MRIDMKKKILKQIRNKMINEKWNEKKAEWEMADLAYLFNLGLAQVYRIVEKKVEKQKTKT